MAAPANAHPAASGAGPNSGSPQISSFLPGGLDRAATVATVMSFIAQTFGVSLRATAIVFLLSVVGYVVAVKMLAAIRFQVPPSLPVMVSLVLVATLVGALLRQHVMDTRIVDLGEVTDTFHWRVWFCFGNEACIANAITNLRDKVPSRSGEDAAQLFSDQALGAVIRTSPPSLQLLRRLYGINQRFLGTGSSLPSGNQPFTSQRIPEYLIPNYDDRHAGVLAWRLDGGSPVLSKPLQDLLDSPPINAQMAPDELRKQIRDNLRDRDRPSLIRFAKVPDVQEGQQVKYSGCFGLPVRHRVFFSGLDYMMGNTKSVKEAADLSGYEFDQNLANQHLYIFMFVPETASEVLVPNWFTLAADVSGQVGAPLVCQPRTTP